MDLPAVNTPIKLTWFDSTSLSGWHYFNKDETPDSTPRLQISRGLLVGVGPVAITLASTESPPSALDADRGYMHLLIVPRGCILAVEEIP